jgi:3-phosphoshikimate 1-carboxyvinyltransferase
MFFMSDVNFRIEPSPGLQGQLQVPGDKSISHRAVILGALADGVTELSGFLEGADCLATIAALRAMGVTIQGPEASRVTIQGVGRDGLTAPTTTLDMGNSGTAMRLLTGVLAGQPFSSVVSGDSSLIRRPMGRIIDPLSRMGAHIESSAGGAAPLQIHATKMLHGIDYTLPVPSAQVKSCVLLAGLYAQGNTRITEPTATRDHTERLLQGFGYPVERREQQITLSGGGRLQACRLAVPADISSAAFFLVGASIAQNAQLVLKDVGINPTRTGVITILQQMGAHIELINERWIGHEPVADIQVKSAPLQGVQIPQELVSLAIDEFPALFIAAACADGETLLTGAEELRVKESDRLEVMAAGLRALGIAAETLPDGMRIHGGQLQGGKIDSQGDHRIAMAFAIAGLRASDVITIYNCSQVDTSFPGFVELAQTVGLRITAC